VKIALVILHAQASRGGAERYTIDLARDLADRGHQVQLLASSFDEESKALDGVVLCADGATRAGRYRRFLKSLEEHLDKTGYDITHAMLPVRRCDLYHPHAGLAAETMARGHLKHNNAGARWLSFGANRLNARRRMFAKVERQLLETSENPPGVLCLSEYVKQTVRRHYPALPETRLLTLFNAVDLKKFDPATRPSAGPELRRKLGIAQSRVVALMIAQDFERKGLGPTIEAVAKLNDQNLILVVVGKQEAGPYREMVRELGLDQQAIFAGSTTDPYSFYSAADFFVLPTRHDPCSLVVLESLAMGVPVISTVFNGACEIMTDGVHGAVLKSHDDASAITQAMANLIDSSKRHDATRACLELRPSLAMETHLTRLEEIYRAKTTESRSSNLIASSKPLE